MMKDDFEGFLKNLEFSHFLLIFGIFINILWRFAVSKFGLIDIEFVIWFLAVIVHYDGSLHVIDGIKNLDLGKYLCIGKLSFHY